MIWPSTLTLAVHGALAPAAPATAAAASTTLRLSTYVNEVDVRDQGFRKFAELVVAKTQSRVKVFHALVCEFFAAAGDPGSTPSV